MPLRVHLNSKHPTVTELSLQATPGPCMASTAWTLGPPGPPFCGEDTEVQSAGMARPGSERGQSLTSVSLVWA